MFVLLKLFVIFCITFAVETKTIFGVKNVKRFGGNSFINSKRVNHEDPILAYITRVHPNFHNNGGGSQRKVHEHENKIIYHCDNMQCPKATHSCVSTAGAIAGEKNQIRIVTQCLSETNEILANKTFNSRDVESGMFYYVKEYLGMPEVLESSEMSEKEDYLEIPEDLETTDTQEEGEYTVISDSSKVPMKLQIDKHQIRRISKPLKFRKKQEDSKNKDYSDHPEEPERNPAYPESSEKTENPPNTEPEENPEEPEENPAYPDKPETPEKPPNTDYSEHPEEPEENPAYPESSEKIEKPPNTDYSEHPEEPEENPAYPESSEKPDKPPNTDYSEHPEEPEENPAYPESSEKSENPPNTDYPEQPEEPEEYPAYPANPVDPEYPVNPGCPNYPGYPEYSEYSEYPEYPNYPWYPDYQWYPGYSGISQRRKSAGENIFHCGELTCPSRTTRCKSTFIAVPDDFTEIEVTTQCLSFENEVLEEKTTKSNNPSEESRYYYEIVKQDE